MRTGYDKFQSVADLVDFVDLLREQVGSSGDDTRDKMRAALASIDDTELVVLADAQALLRLAKELLGVAIDRLAVDPQTEGLAEAAQSFVYVDRVLSALSEADAKHSLAPRQQTVN